MKNFRIEIVLGEEHIPIGIKAIHRWLRTSDTTGEHEAAPADPETITATGTEITQQQTIAPSKIAVIPPG